MNEPLKAGDLIEITGGIECYKYRFNSYHCVKTIGWRRPTEIIVHTPYITGELAEVLEKHCEAHNLSTRSVNCFFDITFKIKSISKFPTGSMLTYEADSIEILKPTK